MNVTQHLKKLKEITMTESDFSVPINYFLEDMVHTSLLTKESQPTTKEEAFYKSLLQPLVKQQGHGVELVNLLLMELKKSCFVHGAAVLSDHRMFMFFYFRDIHVGMAAISGFGGRNDYYRLSGHLLKGDGTPIISTTRSSSIH